MRNKRELGIFSSIVWLEECICSDSGQVSKKTLGECSLVFKVSEFWYSFSITFFPLRLSSSLYL